MWVKAQSRDGVEDFCSNSLRSFPSIQENLRPSHSTVPSISCAQIRFNDFNHVLQLKKQPFNSGARTYRQVGPALVLVWLGQTQFPSSSAIQNCFQCAASASDLTSALFSSPKVWRTVHYFYSRLLPSRAHPLPLPLVHMMAPTFTNIRIRTARDAEIIFHAVRLGILPIVMQRLGSEERMALCSGCIYVWEERSGSLSESMEQGIERFTEGRSWGPSRYCVA